MCTRAHTRQGRETPCGTAPCTHTHTQRAGNLLQCSREHAHAHTHIPGNPLQHTLLHTHTRVCSQHKTPDSRPAPAHGAGPTGARLPQPKQRGPRRTPATQTSREGRGEAPALAAPPQHPPPPARARRGSLRTSLPRIWSSVSCTSMRGRTVVKSFHQGQPFTPLFFLMFFCTQRIARSWICRGGRRGQGRPHYPRGSRGRQDRSAVSTRLGPPWVPRVPAGSGPRDSETHGTPALPAATPLAVIWPLLSAGRLCRAASAIKANLAET